MDEDDTLKLDGSKTFDLNHTSKVHSINEGDSALQESSIQKEGTDFQNDTSKDFDESKSIISTQPRNAANPEDGEHTVSMQQISSIDQEVENRKFNQSMAHFQASDRTEETIQLTGRKIPLNARFQELIPFPYQVSIYNRIKQNWANDKMGFGNIVYLETGTGKTYIAIMILKYLFSPGFISYHMRLLQARLKQPTGVLEPLEPIGLKEEKDINLYPFLGEDIKKRKDLRSKEMQSLKDQEKLKEELKKQKKVVFITPTQNLVEQQATTIEVYTDLCVGRYHGGQKQSACYSDPKLWRQELFEQDVLIVIANKFYDLLTHGFMHMEEIDLLVFDECHHADQDHPYNLIMRDFFFHDFDPDNPFAVKRPMVLGLTASPIKQKIERNKVQATEIEGMLQNLSNNLYARFITIPPDEIFQLEKDLKIDIQTYNSNFDQNIRAIQTIETNLLQKIAELVQFPEQCYKLSEFSQSTAESSRILDRSQIENSMQSIQNLLHDEVQAQFTEEQDTQVLKFLNGRKQMIALDSDYTKDKLTISSFKSYEDKVLVIFCIIIVKNINNLLLEIGPLAVKAFFQDLKRDLLGGMKNEKGSKQSGVKSEKAIKIIDEFCNGILWDNFSDARSESHSEKTQQSHRNHQLSIDEDAFQVSEKVKVLIHMLQTSYAQNNHVKTIIFVKDRSVAVYLKKLLSGDQNQNGKEGKNEDQSTYLLQRGLLDPEIFKIGFAMGFKSKNIVNKAYKALNTEKISMYQDVLGQLPSVRSIKLSQSQLKETLDRFRRSQLNVLIATNVVEEGLDVSTCNQVICLNELLTVKAFIQMKGRARQENSKFVFVCAREELPSFDESRAMFDRVISFMKKITTKVNGEVIPERHVLNLRRQQQEEFYEVAETKAKVTAKQAKFIIEKFCNEFIGNSIQLDEKTKKQMNNESINHSLNAQNLSNLEIDSVQTLTTEQIQSQIDFCNQSIVSDSDASVSGHNISKFSQVQLNASNISEPPDNHLMFRANYVAKECAKEGTKFFFCVLYLPRSCKDIIFRKQNPEKACVKKKDAENHVALQAVKRLTMKNFLTKHLMTNLDNPVIQASKPPPPPTQGPSDSKKSQSESKKSSNQLSTSSNSSFNTTLTSNARKKIVSEQEKQMQRSKQKSFDKHKKQVAFKAPPNQINKKIFARPLTQLLVYVFKGVDADSDYPYKNTHDYLGILFDRKFSSPSMQFLMYQEQRAKQKNAEHLNNLVRKGLLSTDKRLKVELKEECLSIALTEENCFNVELPMKIGNAPTANIESVMAAKIQCYHIWLFYYLYSADFKFIKAIFKLKFEFVKILFARDFSVLFFTNENHSAKVKKRKNSSLQLLEELYFSDDLKQGTNGSYQSQQGKYSQNNRNRKNYDYLMKFKNYVQKPTAPSKVPLLAYNVPVTDRQVRDKKREMVNGNRRMRIDWNTIDKVVEWVRSRIYEVCLPTERTLSLFKFNIDDPVRSFVSSKRTQYKAISQKESEQASFSIKEIKADLGQIERAHLTEHLWDQRFQGNRFVILDQELIHNYQDKLIDLNQGKKEFSLEKHEYKASSLAWCNDFYRMSKSERNRFKGGELNVKSKEFKLPSNYNVGEFQVLTAQNQSFMRSYPNFQAVNQSMNTTMMSGISGQQPFYGEQGTSFRTREFYFLKQGIFEHRLFSKYIVKCRKERHFLDFGKKKRDDELVDEQSSDQLGYMSTSMISDQSRRMMPHGMRAKSFNQQSLKSQRQFILQQEQAKKRTNTEFDILDQMLTLAPISYNQYQVLQTTCYHMLNFNELLMTEQFINTIFGDLKCCLKPLSADNLLSMEPAEASKDILHTYEQLMERSEPDVMGVLVKDQLLNKIDIVKEALTSPGACREYDYERLEFYGDSIIGFLVILELFVTQPAMVEGDLDFKRIQKVSNMKFYEVNKENKFHDYMITESHQVYSGYDHAWLDTSDCNCQTIRQGKPQCTCKRNSSKITQKHQNELQNKLSQLKLIRKRLCELDADDDNPDPLEQIFMRGNIYQLAEMINKDPALAKDYASSEMSSSLQQSSLNQSNKSIAQQKWPMTETEKIQKICVNILDEIGGPRECLIKNINKVIMKVESQISQNYKKSIVKNYRQKGPFYYKQLADVVESVSGAVTLACGLNCTQDYLRKIGVLEFDQAYLMREMTKLLDKQKEKSLQLDNEFYHGKKMNEVEKILCYEFSCKAWLIEALTHKSFSKEHEKQNACLEDYERLEFLGDSVLGCLMARHFFLSTQKDGVRKNPKELHKMKTSVINNNLLSLIVIENKIHEYMIYNTKAPSFKEQFEKYVSTVHEMTKKCGTTKDLVEYKKRLLEQPSNNQDSVEEPEQVLKEFDLDLLHEHNLKIFGDVFESLIGAVFLDSQSVEKTWEILFRLMSPYVQIYANLETLQDHSRTLLLEMWNQKPYTKNLTCKHKTEELENGERSCLKGIIVGRDRQEHVVFAESFNKDAKSKIRTFYKHFYQLVKKFVDKVDLLAEDKQREYYERPRKVIEKIMRLWEKEKEAERKLREMEENAANQTATAFTLESIEEEKKSEVVDSTVIVEEAASEEQEEEEVKCDPVPPRRDTRQSLMDSFDVKVKVSNEYDQEMTKR